ncbi:hypothetical protein FRB96_009659 [Tulasnella sp. 330]|nr:hypothetical protein FRB96_009659 [Tulasnella sp. 330]
MARFLKITLVGMTNVSDTDEIRSLRQIPTWFFRPSFLTDDAYHRFVKSISTVISPFPRTVQWQPTRSDLAEEDGIEENAAGWTSTHDLTSLCNSSQVSWMLEDLEEDRKRDGPIALLENGLNVVLALSGVIHPLLVSTFLDVSGSVAMPSRGGGDGGETEVELLWTVTELASLVFGPIIRSDDTVVPSASRLAAQAQLKLVLVRMTTHFPFGSDASIRRDNKSEGLLNQLNILICELSSLVLLRIGDPENERVSRIDRWSETNAGQVTDWVIKVLRGQIVTGVHPMGQNLSASGYAALLPTIWSLVNDMQGGRRTEQTDITPQQRRVWDAVVDHGTKTSTTSTVKKLAVEFIGRVYALQSDRQYIGSFRLQRHEIQPWLIALPQLLWEIGTLDAICSETILRLLLLAVQRGALEDATAKAISSRLEPYWTVMHRTRGPIAGPWMRLNRQSTVRRLAVDLAMSLRTQYGMNPEDDTVTQTGTSTFDIHNILTLHQFPLPPSSPGLVPRSPVPRSSPSVTEAQSSAMSAEESYVSSGHEDLLQDEYIAQLLASSARDTDSPAIDRLSRLLPPSPTSTSTPRRPSPTPPSPSLPSPLLNVYFPPSGSNHPIQDPLTAASEESKTSLALTNTNTSSSKSRRTTIIRLDAPISPPLTPGATSVVGFARASYIPKSAAAAPPPPIIIPSVYGASNLIDLTSPGPTPPRSPSRVVLSPRASHLNPALSPVHEGSLSPPPDNSRFRVSMGPANLAPLASPSDEAPPNVPEDIISPDDPGPSTAGLTRGGSQHRRRFSMSSLFSRLTRSTQHSAAVPRHAWTQNRSNWAQQAVPPVPALPGDRSEAEKREAEMQLPALMDRAGYLSNLLDAGRLPVRNSLSTYHGVPGTPSAPEHPSPATPGTSVPPGTSSGRSDQEAPWEYSSGDGYVDDTAVRNRRSQSIRSFFTRNTGTERGHFNVLEEEIQRRYQAGLAASSAGASSSARLGSDLPMDEQPASPYHSTSAHHVSPAPSEKSRRVSTVVPGPETNRQSSIWPWAWLHPKAPWRWKRRIAFAVMLNFTILAAIIGMAVGFTASNHRHSSKTSSDDVNGSVYNCPGNWTGEMCNIDATCTCASTGSVCNPLAVAVADIIPKTNALLNTTYTATSVALIMWDIQGAPAGGNCAQQANLLAVDPKNADIAHSTWATAAVLYSALQSEDLVAAEALRAFVNSLDFSSVSSNDTVRARSVATFQKLSSGFIFDFQAMTITAPPLTWRADANPSSEDVAQISSSLEAVLDRFATSASALSNQSATALENYWTKDLSLAADQLPKFITAFQSAPVLLPFDMSLDANESSLAAIMQLHDPKTVSFPPPLACNPMVNSQQLKALNSVEQTVFGLPSISSAPSAFNTSCFGTRPVYGVLDVLALRLPFSGGQSMPLQAAVLTTAATSRVLIRSGAALSSYPSSPGADAPLTALLPADYGTMLHLNHVVLNYLRSLTPSQSDLVTSLVGGSSSTGLNSTALDSIPVLEIAFFGSVGPVGIDHSVSSFSSPSGALFFGSTSGNVFREWAANTAETASEAVVWAESAGALQVVKETAGNDTTFEAVWSGASTIITNANTLGKTTGPSDVETVVGVFGNLGYLSS